MVARSHGNFFFRRSSCGDECRVLRVRAFGCFDEEWVGTSFDAVLPLPDRRGWEEKSDIRCSMLSCCLRCSGSAWVG